MAHNADFDYRILRTEFKRLGYSFERDSICTVSLSQALLPDLESYKLGKLSRSLGIPISDRHRAQGDALATVKLFELLLEKDSSKQILKSQIKAIQLIRYLPNTFQSSNNCHLLQASTIFTMQLVISFISAKVKYSKAGKSSPHC